MVAAKTNASSQNAARRGTAGLLRSAGGTLRRSAQGRSGMRPGACTAGASPCLVIVTERSSVMPNLLLAWFDYLRRSQGFPVGAGGHRGQRSCMTPARPRGKITT